MLCCRHTVAGVKVRIVIKEIFGLLTDYVCHGKLFVWFFTEYIYQQSFCNFCVIVLLLLSKAVGTLLF